MVFYYDQYYSHHNKFEEKKRKHWFDNNVCDNDKVLFHNNGYGGS